MARFDGSDGCFDRGLVGLRLDACIAGGSPPTDSLSPHFHGSFESLCCLTRLRRSRLIIKWENLKGEDRRTGRRVAVDYYFRNRLSKRRSSVRKCRPRVLSLSPKRHPDVPRIRRDKMRDKQQNRASSPSTSPSLHPPENGP